MNLSPPEWESWKSKHPWWKIVEHDRGVYIHEDAATAKYDSLDAAKQGAERYARTADRYMQTIETSPYHEEFKSACVQYISGHERDPWNPSK